MKIILKYDGSFEGFLTAVFEVYEQKIECPSIEASQRFAENLFDAIEVIYTDEAKAKRVYNGLIPFCKSSGLLTMYRAFLSEQQGIEDALLHLIMRSLSEKKAVLTDYSDPYILRIAKTVKMVDREKHRMDAFIRFQLTKDGLYFATVEPDFNVLPLLIGHFKKRYADQRWLIYDIKRNFGLHYDLNNVDTVVLNDKPLSINGAKNALIFSEKELAFQSLWKCYFDSTNIKERKNMKLHLQHVPRRYWKFLSEKFIN
ncbi:DNA metabolism protein [Rasiella rasia]|uniref:DNA metabolism protein n=1 Tax=Rasiella rasia TaxID=2744027 RepID=A0A6G6GNP7_9FLAO|nr:TIGR03915 family putative DNA repair protein [Rasiella rasia]QIE60205.1 DNA metabolism protein [Rasiella rasia]